MSYLLFTWYHLLLLNLSYCLSFQIHFSGPVNFCFIHPDLSFLCSIPEISLPHVLTSTFTPECLYLCFFFTLMPYVVFLMLAKKKWNCKEQPQNSHNNSYVHILMYKEVIDVWKYVWEQTSGGGTEGTLPDCGHSPASPILLYCRSFCYAVYFGISSGDSDCLFWLLMCWVF